MKRVVLYLLLVALYPCACFADLGDADDGYLTEGEYDYGVWLEGEDELIVMGGGGDRIDAWDYSYLEVRYTSTPLQWNVGGILDIALDDYSELLYLDGLTEEISIYDNATALLKGGRIDYIRSFQIVGGSPHITIECQPGWSWLYTSSDITGVSGLWADSTSFNIEFFDRTSSGYDPVWENINIIEIPEPATLVLFGLGGLLANLYRRPDRL